MSSPSRAVEPPRLTTARAVTRTRARFAILGLTGVQVVDTSTASRLIGLIQAIRLLGAEGLLTGIHPDIAQTIVSIGVDLSRVRVLAVEGVAAELRQRHSAQAA